MPTLKHVTPSASKKTKKREKVAAARAGDRVFEGLVAIDEQIVERAAREPCRDCGGPLLSW